MLYVTIISFKKPLMFCFGALLHVSRDVLWKVRPLSREPKAGNGTATPQEDNLGPRRP